MEDEYRPSLRRSDSVCSTLNYSDQDDDACYIEKLWGIHQTLDVLRENMSNSHLDVISNKMAMTDDDEPFPPTYIVLRIPPDVPQNTISWLIGKITGKKRDGGAELIVMKQPFYPNEDYVLHISATKIKFLELAEEMEIMKHDHKGHMREFTVAQIDEFLPVGMNVEDLLTMAERQSIVKHELENIRAQTEDNHIAGFPTCTLYEGQSIFQVCIQNEIVTKVYPLHDSEALKKLGQKWYMSQKQPFEEIRLYFGEAIALYFSFLGYYTTSLLVPVVAGILQLLISSETVPFFCAFNVVWVTLVLEIWKRKSNELAYKWGTIGMTSLDEPRANFRGAMGVDAITRKIMPQYPRYFTYVKMYCVSFPVVFICMLGAFAVMLTSFWAEDYVTNLEPPYDTFKPLPSILYSVLVYVMNVNYRKLATWLTEWENHRTQSQYDRHKVTKLVLFEFVNTFMSLFYIAFVIQDMDMLRSQLQTMLIISQSINNFQEALLPLAIQYYKTKITSPKKKPTFMDKTVKLQKIRPQASASGDQHDAINKVPELELTDSRIEAAEKEGEMDIYEETYDDYLELFIQFGYVFLFSPVYPLAALWAFLNNIIEIRADAFKLCQVSQRPMSKRVKDIGAWQRSFEILGALSILTNCGILYLSPNIRAKGQDLTQVEWILLFVLLEHVLIGIRYLLHITISDKPELVQVALARRNYEMRQAVKHERAQKNRRILAKKFKSGLTSSQ